MQAHPTMCFIFAFMLFDFKFSTQLILSIIPMNQQHYTVNKDRAFIRTIYKSFLILIYCVTPNFCYGLYFITTFLRA